jgi:hypothetical protein
MEIGTQRTAAVRYLRKNEIRFIKLGDRLAVQLGAEGIDHGWLPAVVTGFLDGYPLIAGTTARAVALLDHFHSGVIDSYSAPWMVRLPREGTPCKPRV